MFTDVLEEKLSPVRTQRKVELIEIGMGEIAHRRTLVHMKNVINEGIKNWSVRELAQDIVRHVPERDSFGEVQALFDYVQKHMRYTSDPRGIEMVQSPDVIISEMNTKGIATGDCDDYSVFLGALIKSVVNCPIRLKAVAFGKSDKLSHVYLEFCLGDKWVPCDAIRKDKPLGWSSGLVSRFVLLNV